VSCAGEGACVAVGFAYNVGNGEEAVLDVLSNGAWSAVDVPQTPEGSDAGYLSDVSCPTATMCAAIGNHPSSESGQEILWMTSGGWHAIEAPAPTLDSWVDLSSVSCATATFCVAVGTLDSGGPAIETWNGTTWTYSPGSASSASLAKVSCEADGMCAAIGTDLTDIGVVDVLSGGTWVESSLLVPPGTTTALINDVSCYAGQCVVVGSAGASDSVAVAQVWNGTAWSGASLGLVSGYDTTLGQISCYAASSCVAIGEADPASGITKGLIETLVGGVWTASTVDSPAGDVSYSSVLSCATSGLCVAGYNDTNFS